MIEINDRAYATPDAPTVVVCIDGSEPDYIEEAVKAGAVGVIGASWSSHSLAAAPVLQQARAVPDPGQAALSIDQHAHFVSHIQVTRRCRTDVRPY